MVFCQSCIVADPPEYRDALRTRPLLDAFSAAPSTYRVINWSPSDLNPIKFSVQVQSEDANEELAVRFFLDYGTENQAVPSTQSLPASTYEVKREITFDWSPQRSLKDCHVMSLIVAHDGTFERGNGNLLDKEKAADDAAILNWWVNINPDNPAANTLANCPTTLPTVQ